VRASSLSLVVVSSVFVVVSGPTASTSATEVRAFHVIVHPSNPAAGLDHRFVADAFLKKVTRWPDDSLIRPVDLHPDLAARRRFNEDTLKRSVAAVKSYWQQMVFSGRGVPPPELDDDKQVVRFVLRNPGAIGYVSGGANVEGAKIVPLR
jgi:ABC-type phosphate transport system substrate-binding protein